MTHCYQALSCYLLSITWLVAPPLLLPVGGRGCGSCVLVFISFTSYDDKSLPTICFIQERRIAVEREIRDVNKNCIRYHERVLCFQGVQHLQTSGHTLSVVWFIIKRNPVITFPKISSFGRVLNFLQTILYFVIA